MQRTLSIRPCAEHELESLIAQASRTFRPSSPSPRAMAEAYPLLFTEANRQNLWVACDGSVLVGHAGYVPRTIIGQGPRLAAATFGAVFVDERYRRNQVASQMLAAAVQSARAQGATMGWISGRRDLYQRQGFIPLPSVPLLRIANGLSVNDGALTMAPIPPSQWAAVAAMHANADPRFDRNPEQWQAIFHSGTVGFSPGHMHGATQRDGVLCAYVAIEDEPRLRAGKPWRRVWEWGGDPIASLKLLQALATPHVGIEWVLPPALPPNTCATHNERWVDLDISVARWSPEATNVELPFFGLDYV